MPLGLRARINTQLSYLTKIYKESTGWTEERTSDEIPFDEALASLKESGYAEEEVNAILERLKCL